jgi:hypothetical protein
MYFINLWLFGEVLDPWNALHYYHEWVFSIASLSLNGDLLTDLYISNLANLSAPSPAGSWLIFVITRIINDPIVVFHVINLIVIYGITRLPKKIESLEFILMVYLFTFSFYWYVLIYLTHRFKIAIGFMIFYFLFEKSTWRRIFLGLSFMSHLSIISIFPFIIWMRKKLEEKVTLSSVLLFLVFYASVIYLLVFSADSTLPMLIWQGKASYLEKYNALVVLIVLIGLLSYNHLSRIVSSNMLYTYMILALVLFDRSRLLMVFFVFLTILQIRSFNKFRDFQFIYLIFIGWDVYRSIDRGLIRFWLDKL